MITAVIIIGIFAISLFMISFFGSTSPMATPEELGTAEFFGFIIVIDAIVGIFLLWRLIFPLWLKITLIAGLAIILGCLCLRKTKNREINN